MTEHFLKMEHAADPRLGWDFLISNQPFRVTGPGAIAVRQVAENLRSDNGRSAWSTTRPKASETSKVKTLPNTTDITLAPSEPDAVSGDCIQAGFDQPKSDAETRADDVPGLIAAALRGGLDLEIGGQTGADPKMVPH